MSSKLVLMRGVSLVSLLTVAAAMPAFAQSGPAAPAATAIELDTITVTGEKVERDLRSTASSVAVKTARDIDREDTGNASVSEVLTGTPNVTYTDTVGAPIIRGQDTQGPLTGQNSFWGGTVPRATINVDGHYLSYNEFYFGATSPWDVKSIEVFRGPQTTSQGANAIAGAIVVNTKDPTFTREAAFLTEFGSYSSRRTALMLSGPIIADQLAGRISLDYSGRDSFIDYVSPNFQRRYADQDFRALNLRAKLLWRPTDLPGFEAKLTFSRNSTNRPSQEAASAPFDRLKHTTTTMPSWRQDTTTGILDLSYDFGNRFKLFNQSQYSDLSVSRKTGLLGNGDAYIDQWNASNETRLTYGEQGDVLSGVAGIYYAHTKTDEILYLSGRSTFDDTKRNLGIFGEASYRLTDRWTFTGSLRFQQDQIERAGQTVLARQGVDFDKTFQAVLPKASLAYAVTPDWTVGAMVNRGYNPGGVSLNLNAGQWQPFKEETLWNYELFTRASLLENRLNVSGNLFYTDFKNAQYFIPVVLATGVVQSYGINAEKAHAYGLEVNADYRVLDNLTLKAGAGLLRTEIDKISANTGYKGNEFAKSPGYMLSFGVSWDVTSKFNVTGQLRHTDGYYSDVANTRLYLIKPYTIADLRASYQFTENLQLYGYVKNIFDARKPTYMQQNRGIGGTEASMTEPRMIGVGLKGTF
ncbi:TonB-dependent receptor [Bosea minatitlanensis]|uniref:TonB-dependent receptor n=1 Tax=Bosea minatitlanensis TaxID=128782 RepID=A0ABW0FAB9_9HYPH|nr:TonB-dependent receptor [Bosea minatitlanensis]MCT4495649.1 TonB-dependent receptor [Bosea minatitlanensis]